MTPVITIDGPSGTGKGTIAALVAQRLGWYYLDSGALYRALGLAAQRAAVELDAAEALASLARAMRLDLDGSRVILDGRDVSAAIRTEEAGAAASRVAALPAVREALLGWQRAAARPPGLVADGRDMGSVVFPEAALKVYLTASPEERAQRRYNQLNEKGLDVNLATLIQEIGARDERDSKRSLAPMKAPPGALMLDTTSLAIEEVLGRVLEAVRRVLPDLVV
ncbi:MAG: (d)CMP kinase [Chromatiaceae bacterium]